ncbi:MAG: class I SAM-dependent methyltransferase [Betaproteobacteria bacterium]|nr:class I SAM-dependent methyltransferase [Betaproteobacteria bacterium]NBP37981.1 class I SAM-dependent methyltransferase [Betaproteobacteria bacterium]NBQ79107.1 class I SAM-dependent methyltransferase [Betaproteobacteria bacterium]NBS39719.1 class I SAM-dependent methyltransferase [Betaproteobacteria bacterium]NBT05263.1 class I SAM-dependent methyltransferase [Betaproteobacteria bacterium]
MRNRARYTRVVVQSIRMRGNRVEEHWSQWQREQESDKRLGTHRGYVDWADHPTVWNLVSKEAFGTSGQRSVIGDFADFLACLMSPFERPNALSLCCGNGDFERQLVRSRVLETVDGVDLASARVRAAQEQLANEVAIQERCRFCVADVNRLSLRPRTYDLVIAKSALHHVESLERLFEEIYWGLKTEGCIVAMDFFGPSRFQWSDLQLELAHRLWTECVPFEIRQRAKADGLAYLERPSLDAMMRLDPSEAVRSSEILAVGLELFTLEQEIPLGGTLMNLMLWGDRVNYFDPGAEPHNECLQQAFLQERQWILEGLIESDFRLIVLKPKKRTRSYA